MRQDLETILEQAQDHSRSNFAFSLAKLGQCETHWKQIVNQIAKQMLLSKQEEEQFLPYACASACTKKKKESDLSFLDSVEIKGAGREMHKILFKIIQERRVAGSTCDKHFAGIPKQRFGSFLVGFHKSCAEN